MAEPDNSCTRDLATAVAKLCCTHDTECAFDALLHTIAAICAEHDDPRDVGMGVISMFVEILDQHIDTIEPEGVIDLPATEKPS